MKIMFLSLITVFTLTTYNLKAEAAHSTEFIPQNQPPSNLELAFTRSLGSTILEIMSKHGDNQLFTSRRIEKVTRNEQNDTFDVTLRVIGFKGAHDVPFKLIRMTIRFPGDGTTNYKVISYHKEYISPEEALEYSKNTGY